LFFIAVAFSFFVEVNHEPDNGLLESIITSAVTAAIIFIGIFSNKNAL